MPTYSLVVAGQDDDAYNDAIPDGTYRRSNSAVLCSGVLNPPRAWVSFQSAIPPLATVSAAVLSLTFSTATASATLRISALAYWADLATQPSGATLATADYTVAAHGAGEIQTFDVAALVQAVVNHAGYVGAGRLCLQFDGVSPETVQHSIVSFDGGTEFTYSSMAVTVQMVDLAALQTAIYTRFVGDYGGLETALGGRLACAELPSEAAYPSAVYSISDNRQDYTEGVTIEHARVTFRIFTKDDPDGSVAVALASKLRECFDWAELTFGSGYLPFWMRPDVSAGLVGLDDPGRQMYVQEYELAAQR